jgi:hypothetical protein
MISPTCYRVIGADEAEALTSLEVPNVVSSGLTTLPEAIGGLTALRELDLSATT